MIFFVTKFQIHSEFEIDESIIINKLLIVTLFT